MVDISGTYLGEILAARRQQIGEARAHTPLETLKRAAKNKELSEEARGGGKSCER